MLHRRIRLETSYDGDEQTAGKRIVEKIASGALGDPSRRGEKFFVGNGSAFSGEDDLLRAEIPACCRPRTAVVYHHAQRGLLARCATDDVRLRTRYSRESYELAVPDGTRLTCWRAGLAALTVVLAAAAIVLAPLVAAIFVAETLVGWVAPRLKPGAERISERCFSVVVWPIERLVDGANRLAAATIFSGIRSHGDAFVVSRAVITGAGDLDPGGPLKLNMPVPPGIAYADVRTPWLGVVIGRVRPFARLFHRVQRLEFWGSRNEAPVATYLKLGLTSLVLDALDAGELGNAPRLLDADEETLLDASLQACVRVRVDGRDRRMTALELQHWYLRQVRRFVATQPELDFEARDLLMRWEDTLVALAHGRDRLVGKIDWVTKQHAMALSNPKAGYAISEAYHLLGCGHFARLDAAGLVERLASDEEIAAATVEPPRQ